MSSGSAVRVLRWKEDIGPGDIPVDAIEWLRRLGGPTLIHVAGRDRSRSRVVATLLHGNEPSGTRAISRFLREDLHPMVDIVFFIGAVETALADGGFVHRALPGHRDMNRCWRPPWQEHEGIVAEAVLEHLRAAAPECLVDLHNNTGHNPAYGVAFHLGHAERSLVSIFADRVVHTPIELGTLVEGALSLCPSVTIECGRSGDEAADEAAWRGLVELIDREVIDFDRPDRDVSVLVDPVRIRLQPGTRLAFADVPAPEADVTIASDVDRHNFEALAPGVLLGWLREDCEWPFYTEGAADDGDRSRELIAHRGDRLETARALVPIMMTTDPAVALSDCLFYSVKFESSRARRP